MKYLVFISLFTTLLFATSTPILNVSNVSDSDKCSDGKLCAELTWMTLDEVREITIITEKVVPEKNFNSFKLIEKKEKVVQINDQTSFVLELDNNFSESVGDVYRISIDALYSGVNESSNSGKVTFIVK